ncbi:MAG TPA: 6-bladed beta-propeller, partial [Candidatus Krumholzibacteria bacterium]|nr:6-bladed beta-propeller [Candidatus Krumholzibacteria bacterium]
YITNTPESKVGVYSTAGALLREIGERGTSPGEFLVPLGIAIDGPVLYVADDANNRVQKLTLSGEPRAEFYSESPYDDVDAGPQGVVVRGPYVVVLFRGGIATYRYY